MRPSHRLVSSGIVAAAALLQVSCAKPVKPSPVPPPSMEIVGSIDRTAEGAASTTTVDAKPITDAGGAVRQAVSWNPTILEAAGRIKQQNESISDARSGYLPSIGGGVDLGVESADRDDKGPKFNLTATQMIYDFGKVSGRVEAETAIHDVRKAEFLATVDDVIRSTVMASIEILRSESLAKVAREQINDVRAIGKLVEARTDSGASTQSDKLQAEARVQAAEATALEISSQKQRWESTLQTLVGTTAPIRLKSSFPPSFDKACSGATPVWDNVPAVVAAQSRKYEADARVKLARADMLPTLSLETSSQIRTWSTDNDPQYVVGLQLRGDLYNGGSFRAKQNAARYAAEASQAGIASAKFESQRAWFESAAQVGSLRQLVKSIGARQGMMRNTRDLYQKQFLDLGTRTLLDVLNADQELHAARFDQINSQFDLYKLNTECAYAAGRLREIFDLSAGATKRGA